MFEGRFVFAQVTEFVPWHEFDKFVAKYKGNYRAHGFNCKDQFLHLLFGQHTACSSLRDNCLCLAAHESCVCQHRMLQVFTVIDGTLRSSSNV